MMNSQLNLVVTTHHLLPCQPVDDDFPPPSVQNNMEMYISGLDGPSLDDVCALEELPAELRSRPSYVSMKKGGAKGSVKSGRNQGRPAGGMS